MAPPSSDDVKNVSKRLLNALKIHNPMQKHISSGEWTSKKVTCQELSELQHVGVHCAHTAVAASFSECIGHSSAHRVAINSILHSLHVFEVVSNRGWPLTRHKASKTLQLWTQHRSQHLGPIVCPISFVPQTFGCQASNSFPIATSEGALERLGSQLSPRGGSCGLNPNLPPTEFKCDSPARAERVERRSGAGAQAAGSWLLALALALATSEGKGKRQCNAQNAGRFMPGRAR